MTIKRDDRLSVPLSELLAPLCLTVSADSQVSGLAMDSRRVNPGDLYLAMPGTKTHGASFAAQAVERGAVAMLTDAAGAALAAGAGLPIIVAEDPRLAMAEIAACFHGYPAGQMTTFALTGTNGKTTTVIMLDQALRAAGQRSATIGTLGFTIDGQPLETTRTTITTPESPDLQGLLRTMVGQGCTAMAMEVSSHALALHRTTGIVFDVAGFTNLGRDHLDFHRSMTDYFEAKARLFTPAHARQAVINSDDDHGRILLDRARQAGIAAFGVGLGAEADYRISEVHPHDGGSIFRLRGPSGPGAGPARLDLEVPIAMPGIYNVRNAATALVMGIRAGIAPEMLLPGLAGAVVAGRMQPLDLGPMAPRVYIDFAHTPQAISSALSAINHPELADQQRVYAVVGAGGDRDPAKRPLMGQAAASNADVVIITDDNPRSEPPAEIRAEVMAGAAAFVTAAEPGTRPAQVQVIDGGDRRSAISTALAMARPQDAVAILGKGHERTQEIAGNLIDFDDRAVATEVWAELARE